MGERRQAEDARDPHDPEDGQDEEDPARDDRRADEVRVHLPELQTHRNQLSAPRRSRAHAISQCKTTHHGLRLLAAVGDAHDGPAEIKRARARVRAVDLLVVPHLRILLAPAGAAELVRAATGLALPASGGRLGLDR